MASTRNSDVDLASRVARLTAGQRECLDLVDDHATSKEIARQLGISRHTVDARLRGAIQTLSVNSRREAAIIYRAAMQAEGYQPFAYQSPRIVPGSNDAENPGYEETQFTPDGPGAPDGLGNQPSNLPAFAGNGAGLQVASAPAAQPHLEVAFAVGQVPSAASGLLRQEAGMVSDSAVWTAVSAADFGVRRPPLRLWGGANDLNPAQRVVGILVVTILAMLAFGIFLSGIEALTLLQS